MLQLKNGFKIQEVYEKFIIYYEIKIIHNNHAIQGTQETQRTQYHLHVYEILVIPT